MSKYGRGPSLAYPSLEERVVVRVTQERIDWFEELIERDLYPNRSEIVREALDLLEEDLQ